MPTPSTQPATHRFDTIDLLRGLSILAVVLMHTQTELFICGYSIKPHIPPWLFNLLFLTGGLGVLVFFTVSGFLITLTSIRRFGSLTQTVPSAFYRIRFARIAPPLAALLLVLSVLQLTNVPYVHLNPAQVSLRHALFAVLTFQCNLLQARRGWIPGPWVVLWSLSVEEMFYLFFPAVRLFARRKRLGITLFIALLTAAIAFPSAALWPLGPDNIVWRGENYILGMKNIMIGCLFAVLAHQCQRRGHLKSTAANLILRLAGCAGLLLALLPYLIDWPWLALPRRLIDATSSQPLLLALAAGLIMLAATLHPHRGSPITAPVRWFGRYSYEIYLTHQFVVLGGVLLFTQIQPRIPNTSTLTAPIACIAAIITLSGLLGLLLSRLFSEPMNRLLRGAPLPAQLKPAK